jgi:ribonuclease-3
MQSAERWLEETFRYVFTQTGLLENALTHRSAAGSSNERLEFLGDAILDLVISAEIYALRPEASEGDLSRLRAYLVNDAALAELAIELDIGKHLLLGEGERKSGGHRRQSILADALEALFGAIYLDSGYDRAKTVIGHCFASRLAELPDAESLRDPKTRLQEWLQARGRALPEYTLDSVTGKAHRQHFAVTCALADAGMSASGEGSSRRRAEQAAARGMLTLITGGDAP